MKIIDAWLQYHKVLVLDTQKKAYRSTRMNMNNFRILDTVQQQTATLETEPLYTIEISESELKKVAQIECDILDNLRRNGNLSFFERLIETERREESLRKAYPALKKAYDQYNIILKLIQSDNL